jgi:hypothetical protein
MLVCSRPAFLGRYLTSANLIPALYNPFATFGLPYCKPTHKQFPFMKHTYSFRLLWCLLWLTISPMARTHAQNSGIVWQRTFSDPLDYITIATTPDGSVGVVQSFYSGYGRCSLTKLNADGSVAWTRTGQQLGISSAAIDNGSNSRIIRIANTLDGGFVLLGRFLKPALRGAPQLQDVFLKVDASGNVVWIRELPYYQPFYSNILPIEDGGYVFGYQPNLNNTDATLIKMGSDGQKVWEVQQNSFHSVYAVVTTGGGYAIVGNYQPNSPNLPTVVGRFKLVDKNGLGYFEKTFSSEYVLFDIDYDASDVSFVVRASSQATQNTILKLNSNGDVLFRAAINGPVVVAPNPQDGYLVGGTVGSNSVITRLNRAGIQVAQQAFATTWQGEFSDFALLPNGNLALAGITIVDNKYAGQVMAVSLSTTTPPPSNTTITNPSSLALTPPTYDCNTGQLTLNTSGGNGSPIEYRIIGNRDWSASNTFTIPAHQRQGTTFALDARQSGQVVSIGFTSACGTTTTPQPPVTPPTTPSGFVLRSPDFNCATGLLSAGYSNGNGGPVDFRILGNRDWSSSNEFVIPSWQRNGTTFTIDGRLNNGTIASIQFTTNCGAARKANAELMAISQLNAQLLPNPVTGNELVVEVTGANSQAVDFVLSDLSGRVLNTQRAEGVSGQYRQTMAVGNLIEGMYLLRVSTATQHKTLKVLKR